MQRDSRLKHAQEMILLAPKPLQVSYNSGKIGIESLTDIVLIDCVIEFQLNLRVNLWRKDLCNYSEELPGKFKSICWKMFGQSENSRTKWTRDGNKFVRLWLRQMQFCTFQYSNVIVRVVADHYNLSNQQHFLTRLESLIRNNVI